MLTFTEIKETDAEELAILDKECFSVPWSYSSFLNDAKNPLSYYIIARFNEKIVGYAGFWKVFEEAQITNVAVLKDYRHKKIGYKIIEKLIELAKKNEINIMTLEVRESNIPAISLYKKFGFKEVGVRKDYYKNPLENAILMDLEIN